MRQSDSPWIAFAVQSEVYKHDTGSVLRGEAVSFVFFKQFLNPARFNY